ncbi:MAG: hypothetical protein ACRD8A_11350 [Candidatus Acidiferrales bacterium]
MRASRIAGTVAIVAAAAVSSICGGSVFGSTWGTIWGAGVWIGYNAPALMARIAWQDFSCVLAAVRGCALVGTMLLMTVIAGIARR